MRVAGGQRSAIYNPQPATDMSLNQDQYEKLEAYVGGELDPAAKAEVDKLLAGNPQLRKLMAELITTARSRAWVASRETAG